MGDHAPQARVPVRVHDQHHKNRIMLISVYVKTKTAAASHLFRMRDAR